MQKSLIVVGALIVFFGLSATMRAQQPQAQQGPGDKAPSSQVPSARPFVKGQNQAASRPGFSYKGVKTKVSFAACAGAAADAIRNSGIPVTDVNAGWGLAAGFNDAVFVEIVCEAGFDAALITVTSNDEAVVTSVMNGVSTYMATTICVEGCLAKN